MRKHRREFVELSGRVAWQGCQQAIFLLYVRHVCAASESKQCRPYMWPVAVVIRPNIETDSRLLQLASQEPSHDWVILRKTSNNGACRAAPRPEEATMASSSNHHLPYCCHLFLYQCFC